MALTDAVKLSRKAGLEALRDDLAASIESAETRDKAALARQLAAVLAQIEELPTSGEVTQVDEIAKRRDNRRRAASVVPRSTGS